MAARHTEPPSTILRELQRRFDVLVWMTRSRHSFFSIVSTRLTRVVK